MKEIILTKGYVALVDDCDYEKVAIHSWYAATTTYRADGTPRIYAAKGTNPCYMHRFILQAAKLTMVDHIDGNTLNNQRANLRLCTNAENSRNSKGTKGTTSKYKGVHFRRAGQDWLAQITCNYKNIYIGIYKTEVLAAKAYDQKAKELFGAFARCNFN